MTTTAVADIETQVRERIRSTGLDPVREADAVRVLVDDALAQWEHRSLVGDVAPIADPAGAARMVMDNVAGLGPLQQYLDDPAVEEIWINSPTKVG